MFLEIDRANEAVETTRKQARAISIGEVALKHWRWCASAAKAQIPDIARQESQRFGKRLSLRCPRLRFDKFNFERDHPRPGILRLPSDDESVGCVDRERNRQEIPCTN